MNTAKMITQATLELMKQYPFSEITITMICQEADVSRQTFYRKFKDKKEVIENYFTYLTQNFTAAFKPSATDYKDNLKELFNNFPYPPDILLLLLKNDLFFVMEKAFAKYARKTIKELGYGNISERFFDYQVDFVASTVSSIIRLWIEGGMKETKDELAEMAIIFFWGTYEFANKK